MTDHDSTEYDDNVPVSMRILSTQVRALREEAELTQRGLADAAGFSESQIGSVEQGRRPLKMDLAVQLEKVFKIPKVFSSVVEEQLKEPHPSWFQPFADAEAEAVALSVYGNMLINGLLQTEEYARAVHLAYRPALEDEEVERRIAARLARQQLLTRKPTAHLSFVLEEVTLRRPVGGQEAMRKQLDYLLEVTQLRHVEIQVMPTERAGHAGFGGPFTLVEPPGKDMCAYLEVQDKGQLITSRRTVSQLARRYGILQSQALSPEESAEFIQQLANGER
ncbi:helix-turn-helix transcriptional regulator [Streptomyces sp. HNM0663]|uniref:Helix-turn-helix transcriptional regulator n=1 Tax=Streptomyces chengmaiensis TaxID=3040919 RepID=A0ABT6HSW0_9ACTN|nr:helix-turn-helix transcriptional regulator [Streptomyces chengmaiensis]MDH2391800.1 helix-turn-helix transcriptional regulator [Streptomyces chengmaiensis]